MLFFAAGKDAESPSTENISNSADTNQTKPEDSFLPGVVVDGLLASINCQDGSTILITVPPMADNDCFSDFLAPVCKLFITSQLKRGLSFSSL